MEGVPGACITNNLVGCVKNVRESFSLFSAEIGDAETPVLILHRGIGKQQLILHGIQTQLHGIEPLESANPEKNGEMKRKRTKRIKNGTREARTRNNEVHVYYQNSTTRQTSTEKNARLCFLL